MSDPLPPVVEEYFARANAEAWDGFGDLWHEDAVLSAFGRSGRRLRRGRAEILPFYHGLFRPWSAHHDEVVRAVVCGDAVTAEVAFSGRTPEGRPVAFDVVDLFDLQAGRIRRLAIWHDIVTARAALQG